MGETPISAKHQCSGRSQGWYQTYVNRSTSITECPEYKVERSFCLLQHQFFEGHHLLKHYHLHLLLLPLQRGEHQLSPAGAQLPELGQHIPATAAVLPVVVSERLGHRVPHVFLTGV